MKRLFAILLALAMLLSAAAFAENSGSDTASEEAAETESASDTAGKVLLATVDGEKVYDTDCENTIKYLTSQYAAQGIDTNDDMVIAYIKETALSNAIQVKLLLKKAKELGLVPLSKDEEKSVTDEAKAQWESIIEDFETNSYGITDASTEEERSAARVLVLSMLESEYNYTEESWIQEAVTNTVLNNVQAKMTEGAEVTDKEITDTYDQVVEQYKAMFDAEPTLYEQYTQLLGQPSVYIPKGYRAVSHILLPVDEELMNKYLEASAIAEEAKEEHELTNLALGSSSDESSSDEADKKTESGSADSSAALDAARKAILDSVKDKIDEINAEIKKGTDFSTLVEKFGTDPGMTSEPYKTEGYMVHKDSAIYDPAFVNAAFQLEKPGDVGEPVISSFGVHILKYLNDVEAGPVKMSEEVRETIKQNLLSSKIQELFTTKMNEWMSAAKIDYTDEGKAYLAYSDMLSDITSDSLEAALEDQELTAEAEAMLDEALIEDALYGDAETAEEKSDTNEAAETKPKGGIKLNIK